MARRSVREEDVAVETAKGGGDDKVGLKIWAHVRSNLWPVEEVMRSRHVEVKSIDETDGPTVSGLVKREGVSDFGKEINASDDESKEFKTITKTDHTPVSVPKGFSGVREEIKLEDEAKEQNNAVLHEVGRKSNNKDREESCPWKDELDALVQGGVPMALRGEVVGNKFG